MTKPDAETLEVLACEIDARPAGAPGIDALAAAIVAVERESAVLVVSFAPSALETVQRFVAAEQQCCASIRWNIEHTPKAVRLRIGASPAQLELLEQLFTG